MSNGAKPTKRSKRQSPQNTTGTSELGHDGSQQVVQLQLPIQSTFYLKQAFGDLLTQAGTLMINAFIQDEVDRLAGPRYAHDDGKQTYRHGTAEGHAVIGGKKVPIQRPRLRDEEGEVDVPAYRLFADPGQLDDAMYAQMMRGISTRDYRSSVEAFGSGYGIEKSSVSRHFTEATAQELKSLTERPLAAFSGPVIMIDGVHFAGTVFIVALGIAESGEKQVLGLWSGATEHSESVGCLLDDLIARGLATNRSYLFAIDGSKALAKGINSRFGSQAHIQRCRVHKKKNILDHLPKKYHAGLSLRLAAAWSCVDYQEARTALQETLRFLEGINTHAARSLEEALDDLLTVQRLNIHPALQSYLATTNMIENLFSLVRRKTRNVKRWQDKPAKGKTSQDMRQRWAASALIEAEKSFNRVRHYRHLTALNDRLCGIDQKAVSA